MKHSDPAPTNVEVASRIGVTPAAVSRFRGGSRIPRPITQSRIAEVFGWSAADQLAANLSGSYAAGFEEAIRNRATTA
jgi:transcriptional regulator with XRE-family HTH domain